MNQNFLSTNDRFVNNNNNNNTVFQLIIDRLNSYQSNENYHHYYLPIIDHHHRRRRSIDHPNDDYDDDRNISIISTEQTIFPSTLTYSTVIKQLLINTDNNNENVILLSSMASTTTTTTTSPSSSSLSSITDQSTVWDPNLITDPLWTTIPMTILYILILVTGVIGNVLTCVVIARNRYMHTATNYYLFSLAISDLLLLVLGLPQEIYQIWYRYPYIFGEAFCILRGFSSEASTNSSVLTITAFTMERYIAICHPLRAHTMSKLSRAIKLIIIIWLLGFLCAAPIAYQFGIVFDYLNDQIPIKQSAACNIKRSIPYLEEHIFALSSLIVFVLPVTWITVLYILIGIKLRQSSKNTNPDLSRNSLRRRRIKRRFRAVTLSKRFIHLASSSAAAHNSTTTTTSTITSDNISIDENDQQQQQQQQQGKQQRSRTLIKDLNEITISSSSSGSINNRLNKNDDINVETTTATKSSDVMKCFTGTGNHIIQQQESFSIPSSPLMIVEQKSVANNNNNKSFQRQKMKMSKFKSSSTISNSSTSSSNSLAQRRAVIKMLSKTTTTNMVHQTNMIREYLVKQQINNQKSTYFFLLWLLKEENKTKTNQFNE
ncbi:uncharacterized protein LOC113799396 isoform X2 [Dermatophagoides pteronyssinus]|uniref:uncharacterized protein LOC113799396 isoform X2 n=1 Tax=Dermatophagoides pteronyssinus TaxID=6956 RepID=UPI003F6677FA